MCAEKSLISLVGSATWSPRSSPLLKAFGSVTGASEVPGPPCRESRRLGNGGGGINSEYSRRWSCRDGPQLLQQLAGTRPIVNLALFFLDGGGSAVRPVGSAHCARAAKPIRRCLQHSEPLPGEIRVADRPPLLRPRRVGARRGCCVWRHQPAGFGSGGRVCAAHRHRKHPIIGRDSRTGDRPPDVRCGRWLGLSPRAWRGGLHLERDGDSRGCWSQRRPLQRSVVRPVPPRVGPHNWSLFFCRLSRPSRAPARGSQNSTAANTALAGDAGE